MPSNNDLKKSQDAPFFTRFLEGREFPNVKTGIKAGTGCEFTYTPNGPNSAVLSDVICTPQPYPPGPGTF
ncbi:MAG: hypothetical protein MI923_00850 [Phycisphaerales bacterium]|nr:hypothetical protein [Phycisphaerales bacterium]